MIGGCEFGDSEVYKLKSRIAEAHAELAASGTTSLWFTYELRTNGRYVLVVLPAEHVSGDSIQSADLPFEAKESIERQIEHRDLEGPLLGLVEADRSEWHPLPDGVSVPEVLYAWKQRGESVSVNLTRREGRTVIASIH
jgi:hypothetical protein